MNHAHIHTESVNALKIVGDLVCSVAKNNKMAIWDIEVRMTGL